MDRIMVGIGSSEGSHPALDWALDYAAGVSAEVELVHVVDFSWRSTPASFAETVILEAEQQLRELAASRARETPVTIHSTALVGSPTQALVEHAKTAAMLVVGTRGTSGFNDHSFNTRAVRVAGRSTASVVVVPHRPDHGVGIVVGVDGSENSVNPLAFAAREADRLGEPLRVIHCWHDPIPLADYPVPDWPMTPEETEQRMLSEAVAGLADTYPNLQVSSELVFARAADALHDASHTARMLVVGSHGRRGVEKFFLGSTSEELVLSMPSIVAVIR